MTTETFEVEIVCTSGPLPFVAAGRAVPDGDDWIINLSLDASHLSVGSHAIVTFADLTQPRLICKIRQVTGNRIVLEERIVRERERRAFPRLVAGVQVNARALQEGGATAEAEAWMRGDDGPSDRGLWFRPDELINFSVTGLRIDAPEGIGTGQVLLLELGLRSDGPWRCTAEVVRTFAPANDGDERQVAIEFLDIPKEAEAALADLTLSIQDRMIT